MTPLRSTNGSTHCRRPRAGLDYRCGSIASRPSSPQSGPVMVPAIARQAQPEDVLRSLWEKTARAGSTRHPFHREVLTDLNTVRDKVAAAAPDTLVDVTISPPGGTARRPCAVLGDPGCSSPRPAGFGCGTSLKIGETLTPSMPSTVGVVSCWQPSVRMVRGCSLKPPTERTGW